MMQSLLVEAIRNRRRLHVQRHENAYTVEPHAYGHDFCGRPVLLCYQVESEEDGGGWKLIALDAGTSITEDDACFAGARPGYRRGHGDLSAALASL